MSDACHKDFLPPYQRPTANFCLIHGRVHHRHRPELLRTHLLRDQASDSSAPSQKPTHVLKGLLGHGYCCCSEPPEAALVKQASRNTTTPKCLSLKYKRCPKPFQQLRGPNCSSLFLQEESDSAQRVSHLKAFRGNSPGCLCSTQPKDTARFFFFLFGLTLNRFLSGLLSFPPTTS